jgi:hypothetical protein
MRPPRDRHWWAKVHTLPRATSNKNDLVITFNSKFNEATTKSMTTSTRKHSHEQPTETNTTAADVLNRS